MDDTSYFVSRFTQFSSPLPDDQNYSNSDSDAQESCSNSGVEVWILLLPLYVSVCASILDVEF